MTDISLKISRHKNDDGWFFATSDDVPGLFLFGPSLDALIEEAAEAASLLAEVQLKTAIGSIEEQLRAATSVAGEWPEAGVPVRLPVYRPVAA